MQLGQLQKNTEPNQPERTMTDTPETDNLARGNHVVPTEFAQQLERERDEAREDVATWKSLFDTMERAGAEQARRADENKLIIAAVTEQRDRLAELLSDIYSYAKGKKPHDYHKLTESDRIIAAFDAWQEIESKIEQLLQTTPTQPNPK